jgi:hypothetical protein
VRKIYLNMLTRRLRDDQRRTDKLNNAYQRIRTATGLDDVAAIVAKYKARDTTFAALQAQMKSARDRVDALAAERKALVWALDEATTTGAAALEQRALYNSTEDYDRRAADASRKAREARDRFHRVAITLEECRACIAKMMERVALDPSLILGTVAGTLPPDQEGKGSGAGGTGASRGAAGGGGAAAAAAPAGAASGPASAANGARRASFGASAGERGRGRRGSGNVPAEGQPAGAEASAVPRGSAGAGAGRRGSTRSPHRGGRDGAHRVVSAEALEGALASLEVRVGQLLAHLAAVFEREEAAQASSAKAKAKARRGAGGAASVIGGSPRTAGGGGGAMSMLSGIGGAGAMSILDGAGPAPASESDAAAHRTSVAALTEKASARVFQRLMTLQPDVSERNVRVGARASSPEPSVAAAHASAMALLRLEPGAGPAALAAAMAAGAAGGSGGGTEDLSAAIHKSAADLSKLLHGAGAGAVVDRVSLKRLSAMVSSSLTKNAGSNKVTLRASMVGAGAAAGVGAGSSPRKSAGGAAASGAGHGHAEEGGVTAVATEA